MDGIYAHHTNVIAHHHDHHRHHHGTHICHTLDMPRVPQRTCFFPFDQACQSTHKKEKMSRYLRKQTKREVTSTDDELRVQMMSYEYMPDPGRVVLHIFRKDVPSNQERAWPCRSSKSLGALGRRN